MFIRTIAAVALLVGSPALKAQVEIRIQADQAVAKLDPRFYGLMTEEINHSYEGGLYAELVRNRSFKEDPKEPVHWSIAGAATMALDPTTPLNEAIATSLKVTASAAGCGVANEGFWGIPVRPDTTYHASFYAKGSGGPLTVSLEANSGAVHAHALTAKLTGEWKKYEVKLVTGKDPASVQNQLTIRAGGAGTFWLGNVSLFPPTYANRANGNRPDLMQLLADMKPQFLRFPGGDYLEGFTVASRFDWKKTLGDVAKRPGHQDENWGYWSTDGMGLQEFLNWCEDLHMQPLLAVYAGYSKRIQALKAGPELEPYVQEALEEIEYVTGATSTKWGAVRAQNGHPAPFQLDYVEVGNEDQFDKEPGSYDARFAQFFDAIRAKYPKLKIIATTPVTSRVPDVIDEHYYRSSEDEMASHANDYDARPRTGPKVFVGEWATRVGDPTPTMSGALGDAAWMVGMENNADLVIMECYAPLFVNVNPGAMRWRSDLIGYDAMTSYGSPSYWVQQMFGTHHGDTVVKQEVTGVPTREWRPPVRAPKAGQPAQARPGPRQVPLLFFGATRDSRSGKIYLRVVNRNSSAMAIKVSIAGVRQVDATGNVIVLAAGSPEETNSITEPKKLLPATSKVTGLASEFTREFPAYSVSILEIFAPR
jgi:alpha-N-arabinofuranosidase